VATGKSDLPPTSTTRKFKLKVSSHNSSDKGYPKEIEEDLVNVQEQKSKSARGKGKAEGTRKGAPKLLDSEVYFVPLQIACSTSGDIIYHIIQNI
jgi:hypothetical protein